MKKVALMLLALLSPVAMAGNVSATLVSETDAAVPGTIFWVALRQDIREGWHTYWRNPGDSGQATSIAWDLPEGVTAGEIQWPWPERIAYGPLMNYGYHGVVLLPVPLRIDADFAGETLELRAQGHWLVCADVCIPEDASLSLSVPIGSSARPSAAAAAFRQTRAVTPVDPGLRVRLEASETEIVLFVPVPGVSQARVSDVAFFPYTEGVIDNPAPQPFEVSDNGIRIRLKPGYDYQPGVALGGILLVDEDAGEAIRLGFEINPVPGAVGSSTSGAGAGGPELSLLAAIALALLGGAILNLMPCVFPVLSIKILSLVSQSREDHSSLKVHGLVYAAGVVVSFVAIAALLIALRAGGLQIGWGYQLQSPIVVCLLAYLLFAVGLNLSGQFEIGTSVMGLGSRFAEAGGYGGSFFTGVLATVVAAPCTAPFMGAAIGFALTQNSFVALLVFAALGAGMAIPYLALCYAPRLLQQLPRPGPWMARLKEFLAFPMFASVVWLAWVLSLQTGSNGVLIAGGGMVLIGLGTWLLGLRMRSQGAGLVRYVLVIFCLGVALGAPTMLESETTLAGANQGPAPGYDGPVATPYSVDALRAARQDGPVFVNFTAAWCITCKVNEAMALSKSSIREAFADRQVTYLKGDWTSEDPVITRALSEYERSGVPLYLFYARSAGKAVVLPQVLTESIVLDAIAAN